MKWKTSEQEVLNKLSAWMHHGMGVVDSRNGLILPLMYLRDISGELLQGKSSNGTVCLGLCWFTQYGYVERVIWTLC